MISNLKIVYNHDMPLHLDILITAVSILPGISLKIQKKRRCLYINIICIYLFTDCKKDGQPLHLILIQHPVL